ncbi:MAG: TIGR03982 family His-Xaa-Ser system protein [Limisphaerales bacterium]
MKRFLVVLNLIAALVVVGLGVEHFVAPRIAVEIYSSDYKDRMFECDHVMREHFIAKQMVLAAPSEETIRNLDAAEVGLTSCHAYDDLRKRMIAWGVTENRLATLGLEAIEERASEIRHFVEIHEIRY